MKQLLRNWTKSYHETDQDTGKQGKLISTEIISIYRMYSGKEIAEVETICDDIYIAETGAKLIIETPEMDGITKKEYKELVRASLSGRVDESKLDAAIHKSVWKVKRMLKIDHLFYHPDYVETAIEIYNNL